jgi:hypothetical protein
MDTLIVYLDDADYAQHILAPMLIAGTPTRWVLVACAPRMSRRIGKWLSHSSRENWRNKWCDKLFSKITPIIEDSTTKEQLTIEYVVAQGALPELTQQLRTRFGAARVVDARRPKFGQEMAPITENQPLTKASWQIPGAVGSLSALLVLAAE